MCEQLDEICGVSGGSARVCRKTLSDRNLPRLDITMFDSTSMPTARPIALAVLRQIADAARHRVARRPDRHLRAVHEDFAGFDRIGAEHRARDLGAAGAHQAGKAQ